jgi:hypothetical protein
MRKSRPARRSPMLRSFRPLYEVLEDRRLMSVSPFPIPLTAVAPLGSLVYDGSVSASIDPAGDSESYTIALDPGQTLSLAVKPAAGLQPAVRLYNSASQLLGSAQAAVAGQEAVLQTVAISSADTYTITLQGANSTTGQFTAELVLNAALQPESNGGTPGSDDTIAGAQDLTSSFTSLSNGGSRAAVLGNVPGGLVAGNVLVSERTGYFGGKVAIFDNNGNLLGTIDNPALNAGVVTGVQLGPDNTIYVGVDTSGYGAYGAELVHLDANGNLLGTINLPKQTSDDYYFNYPSQFKVAGDGSFWVPQPSVGNVIHVDSSGNLIQSYNVGGGPWDVTVRADGQVFIANRWASAIQQLDPSSGNVSTFVPDYSYPFGVSFAQQGGNGDLVVTDYYGGVSYYNSSGGVDKSTPYIFGLEKAEPDSAGNTFAVSLDYGNFLKYDTSGNFVFNNYLGARGLAVVGVDGGVATPPDTSDYYSIRLTKGQSATISLTQLQGSGASFDLENGAAKVLALPHPASTGLSINEFVAQASGTYYLHVTGNGVKYNLVVTKNSDFDTGPNQTLAQTQSLGKGTGVLGYAGPVSLLAKPGGPNVLYHFDFTYDDTFSQAFANLGITPAVATSYVDFDSKLTSGMWDLVVLVNESNDTSWETPLANYVAGGGSAILESWTGGEFPSALSAVAGAFGAAFTGNNDGTSISQTTTTDPIWSGISNPFDLTGPSFGIFSTGLQATTGQSIGQFPNNDAAIIVGNNRHTILNGFLEDAAASRAQGIQLEQNEIAAVLARNETDYYSFSANSSDSLTMTTSTPGDGSGQFDNTFDPKLILYGPNGAVVASDDNSAGDGRNAKITYKVAGDAGKGTYTVEVLASPLTATPTGGEYVLSLTGNTGATPFTVSGTNPAPESIVASLPSVTVDFSSPIYLPSLSNSSLTVDGKAATGFTVNNDHEVVFTLPALSGTGHNLTHKLQVASTVLSIQGTALSRFSETITVDNLAPKVIKTSVEEGNQLSPGTLKYKVTFDDTIDASVISIAGFDLHGKYRNTDYTPVSYSLNTSQTALTITYQDLIDDVYTLTDFSQAAADGGPVTDPNGIRNIVGLALDGEPNTPQPPSVPSGDGVPGGNFFVDFTVDTNQPVPFPTLQARAPVGSLVYQASTTDVITTSSDTDTFKIKMNAGQTLTMDLTSDSNLQGAVTIYGPNAAGVGSTVTAAGPGGEVIVQTVPVTSPGTYQINVIGAKGTLGLYHLTATLNAAVQTPVVSNGGIGLSGYYYSEGYFGQPNTVADAAALASTPTATFLSTLFSGTTYSGRDYDSVQSFLGTDASGLNPTPPNDGIYTSYFDMQGAFTVSAAQAGPASFTLTSDDGAILTIDGSQVVNDDGLHPTQTRSGAVNLTAGTHTIELQYFNRNANGNGGTYLSARGTFANGASVLSSMTATAQDLTSSFVALPGNGTRGAVEGRVNSSSNLPDFYSFTAGAGQSISLGVLGSAGAATLELLDSDGAPLALGGAGSANYLQTISNFVARSAGTYYVRVQGAPGSTYNLVVTRGLAIDSGFNDTQAKAQDITATMGGGGGLGSITITPPTDPPTVLDYSSGFSAPANLVSNGSAVFTSNVALLTDGGSWETGSVFSQNAVPVSNFNTNFTFQISPGNTADGITFTIQGVGPNTFGWNGGGLGYETINHSVAIKFDLWDNAGEGIDSTGLYIDGAGPFNIGSIDLSHTGIDLHSGDAMNVTMNYNGAILNVTITDTVTKASASQSYAIDIPSVIGSSKGFVGFTAGTGNLSTVQEILNWTYQSSPSSTNSTHFYSLSANAGDTLKLSVSLPFSGPGQFVDGLSPVITLFDPNGTQLATGNKSLTYKVPAGKAGQYAVQVSGANSTQGEYVLSVKGETGALAPVTVTKVNPAAGAILKPPSSVTVDFNHSIDLATLSASELTVTDATHPAQATITATGFSVVNDHEVTWYLPGGFNGNAEDNHLQIAGGKIQDLSGATLPAYSEDYTTDNLGPTVVATSIQEGGLVPAGSLTYVVTFSEPIDPSNVSAASFNSHGNYLNADYTAASFSFDATATVLTINYTGLPDDTYRLFLFSAAAVDNKLITNPNGFRDLLGNAFDGEPVGFVLRDNTGVDSSGKLLPDGAIDPHYTIVSSPDGTGPAAYVTMNGGPWFAGGPTSKWISPAAEQSNFSSNGQYDYQTTVDLTGADLTNAVLTGQVSADEYLVDILVDGVSTGITAPNQFFSYSTYTIGSSFFHAGVNTLDFLVFNTGGATGLRNEMALTAPTSGSTIPPQQSGNGIPGGNYYVDFITDAPTSALPTPLTPLPPVAAQVAETPMPTSGVIAPAVDTDEFTISLEAGQKATVDVTASPGLIATAAMIDPNGVVVGTATGSGPGSEVVLQTRPAGSTGAYTIRVGGVSGSTGAYAVSLVVNAALENESHGGPSNNDPAAAQAIDGSSISVGAGDQLAVLGRSRDPDVYSFQVAAGQNVSVSAGLKTWESVPTYGPRTDYGENYPSSVALGDVNGDGILDMVSADYYGWDFTVRLGNGDGTFGSPNPFGYGPYPNQVVLADVNGDGKLDASSSNFFYDGDSVSVMLGNGDGTFGPAVGYFAGNFHDSLAVSDLNHDGMPDIVTTNNSNGTVSVLLNNGDGTFGSPTSYSIGDYGSYSVATADVDNDGNLDVIVGTSNGVAVLLNSGNGTFGSPAPYYFGSYTSSVAVGDVNGDGRPDIMAIPSQYYGTVFVVLNNGDGTFGSPTGYSINGNNSSSVALGDLNNDGKLDIVVGSQYDFSYSGGVVSVLLNNGDGTFGPAQNASSGYGTSAIAVGDLNKDGYVDVVTANSSSLSVLLHQSPPTLELVAPDLTTVLASSSPADNYDAAIVNFTATQSGTYYILVSAAMSPVDYTLIVTRNTDLPDPPSGNSLTSSASPATAMSSKASANDLAMLGSAGVDVGARPIWVDLALAGRSASGSDISNSQRAKDVAIMALDAVFAQYDG